MKIPVEFDSRGDIVRGKLYLADGDSSFLHVLLLQGFPGNSEDVLELGQRMSELGLNALTFNYRGTHQSEGVFSFANTLQDIEAAIDYLKRNDGGAGRLGVRVDRLVLVGSSYGGGMALSYAAQHADIRRIVSVAGTDHGQMVRAYLRDASLARALDAWFEELQFPSGPIRLAGKTALQEELLADPNPYDLRLGAPALADRQILLIGGLDDLQVTLEDHLLPFYRALAAAGARRVELVAVRDDHAFQGSRDELARIIVRWIGAMPGDPTA